ncbi:MAG: M56 family metallopeptidase [Candidatus Magasanikbacteria bacterium]|nr:M56 family metallopeptidase [Candidatus Magasanikbacteria bacterium]
MSNNFTTKSQQVLRNIVILATAVLVGLLIFGFFVYQRLFFFSGMLLDKIKSACGCTEHLSFSMHPFIISTFVVLGLGLFAGAGLLIYKTIKFKKLNHRFVRAHLKRARPTLRANLRKIADELGLAGKVVEIREQSPTVFCYGFFQTKICVSDGLILALSEEELRAVLRHERRHLLNRDPLKLFCLKLGEGFFFFVPGFKALVKQYITYSEMAADEEVGAGDNEKISLAGALFKIINQEEQTILRNGLALSFFNSVIEERVNRLSDASYAPVFKIFNRQFFAAAAILAVILLSIMVLFKDSSAALATHQELGSCQMQEMTAADNKCAAESNSKQVCEDSYLNHAQACEK